MDHDRFDDLARRWAGGVSRRAVLKGAAGGVLAAALGIVGGGDGYAQEVGAAACSPIGTRCGRKRQPSCNTCCTGFTSRQRNGQRRCACRPDFKRCNRNDQCCSGICQAKPCAGFDERVCIPGLFGGC